ncbi:MAG: hypothetical protein SNG27_10655 [Rikenellaceae bacterium]
MKKHLLSCLCICLCLFAKSQNINDTDSIILSTSPQTQEDSSLLQIDTLSYTESRLTAISENLFYLLESEAQKTPRYQLFPTTNRWTFIKLDTKKGSLTHVQYSVGDGDSFEYSLGSPYSYFSDTYDSLVENGRFTLYPTQNMYNFILLDQITGRTWQVQWNQDRDKRMVVPINYSYGQ